MPEIWLVILGSAPLLMRVGLALQHTGLSRSKNAAGPGLRNIADLAVGALAFWAVGGAILSKSPESLFDFDGQFGAKGFFYATLALLASGLVLGSTLERSRFVTVFGSSLLMCGIVFPLAGHWAWFGWLRRMGFVDVAGASVIHLSAAVCATVGALVVGPRIGKYNRDGSTNMIPGHNIPLALSGSLMMAAVWALYVIGCAIAHGRAETRVGAVAVNTLVAGAAGGLLAMLYGRLRFGKADLFLTLGGLTGGLVAVGAAAASVGSIAAFLIGAFAGVFVPWAIVAIDLDFRLDDPASVVAIHGFSGLWGTLAAGLLLPGGLTQRFHQLGVQAIGAGAIAAMTAVGSVIVFLSIKFAWGIRCKESEEFDGLDLAEHDLNAYPDFQQTTIKSYHLREL
jgi:ammonium transporter, Amt family